MWKRLAFLSLVLANCLMTVSGCGGTSNVYEDGEDDMRLNGNQSTANTLTVGDTSPITALQINLTDPDGQQVSGTMTLSFSVQPPNTPPPGDANPFTAGVFDCQAIISWAIGSNRT